MNKITEDINGNKSSRRIGFFTCLFSGICFGIGAGITALFKEVPVQNAELILGIVKTFLYTAGIISGAIAADQIKNISDKIRGSK